MAKLKKMFVKPSQKQEENSKTRSAFEAELTQNRRIILKDEEKAIEQKQEDEQTDAEELTIIIEESPALKNLYLIHRISTLSRQ